MSPDFERAPRLLSVGYGLGLLLVGLPLLEWSLTIWPMRPGATPWRFAAVGLLSQALLQPIIGFTVVALTAWAFSHRGLLKALGVIYLLAAVGIVGALGLFALDSIEMRSLAVESTQLQVEVTGVRVILTYLAYGALFTWLALGTWTLGRRRLGEKRPTNPSVDRGKLIGSRP